MRNQLRRPVLASFLSSGLSAGAFAAGTWAASEFSASRLGFVAGGGCAAGSAARLWLPRRFSCDGRAGALVGWSGAAGTGFAGASGKRARAVALGARRSACGEFATAAAAGSTGRPRTAGAVEAGAIKTGAVRFGSIGPWSICSRLELARTASSTTGA